MMMRAVVRMRVLLSLAAIAVGVLVHGGNAHAQQASASIQSRSLYAGVPFLFTVSAQGFDEDPQPEVESFEIPGCTVTFVGARPSVSTSISIVNGRRSESRRVEFAYRYRVEAPAPGIYEVPAITVSQGARKAQTRAGNFEIRDVASTRDMRLQLTLPDRPVSVGEAFDVTLDWYLSRDVGDQSFGIPLFDADFVEVQPAPDAAPAAPGRRAAISFSAGDREIELPFTREQVTFEGRQYTRFRFVATVTPLESGTFALPPARVVAQLEAGTTRDAFGFRSARMEMFKAEDVPRTLEVRPLPAKDRPQSFANAVGTAFSIQAQASRTVVKVGDPVELELTIRGDARLDGLSLPPLDNAQGLPPDRFTVADTPTTGEIIDLPGGGKAKRFRVTVRLTSADVREIPPIGFSYYNPKSGTYQTAWTQPIALSVEGSSVVGAGDVVSAVKQPGGDTGQGTGESGKRAEIGSYVGADLSLSAAERTMQRPLAVAGIRPVLYALYLVPLLLLAGRLWQVRTRDRRDRRSGARSAWRAVAAELERAAAVPAREAAPGLLSALRALAAATGQPSTRGQGVIERIETVAYSPDAARAPLDPALLAEARTLARQWLDSGQSRDAGRGAAAMLVLGVLAVFIGIAAAGGTAHAGQAAGAAGATEAVGAAGATEAAGAAGAAEAVGAAGATEAVGAAGATDGVAAAAGTAGTSGDVTADGARRAYQAALAESDRDARTRAFSRAELLFRQLVEHEPGRPELLTDWGNAALGAQDLGRATLAYRRALALDPGAQRAERNLAWVRERQPSWLPRPAVQRARDSLFFWHHALSLPARHLLGGLAFALAVLLLIPWPRHRPALRRLAVLPGLVWIAMIASILLADRPTGDAVLIADSTPLLSADSPGAPAALQSPLPAGAELTVLETRGGWSRVSLADGTKGWVPESGIARVLTD